MTWDEVKAGQYTIMEMKPMPNWEPKYREAQEKVLMRTAVTYFGQDGKLNREVHPIAVLWNEDGRPCLIFKAAL